MHSTLPEGLKARLKRALKVGFVFAAIGGITGVLMSMGNSDKPGWNGWQYAWFGARVVAIPGLAVGILAGFLLHNDSAS